MISLVTGGTGFLGRHVVGRLASGGATVRCLVRATSNIDGLRNFVGPQSWSRIETTVGDLTDARGLKSALEGVDVVYHLAAGMTGAASTLVLNSVIPTRVLAEAAAQADVRRFVLVSSLGVYGAGELRPWDTLDESCPIDKHPHRRDTYSYTKILQESACRDVADRTGLPLVIVRPGVIIGPGRGALSTRIGLTFAGRTIRIGGSRLLPYTYVENCAAAICSAGTAPGVTGETFNIIDDELPSVSAVLNAYRRCGKRLPTMWFPQAAIGPVSSLYEWYHRYSNGQVPGVLTRYRTDAFWKPLRFSNRNATTKLNWKPHVPMAEALERAITGPASGSA